MNPVYQTLTIDDLKNNLRYCLALIKDKAAPDNMREDAKDEAIALQFEISQRKAVQA